MAFHLICHFGGFLIWRVFFKLANINSKPILIALQSPNKISYHEEHSNSCTWLALPLSCSYLRIWVKNIKIILTFVAKLIIPKSCRFETKLKCYYTLIICLLTVFIEKFAKIMKKSPNMLPNRFSFCLRKFPICLNFVANGVSENAHQN